MTKSRLLALAFSGAVIFMPLSVSAGSDSGFYIGAGAGGAPVEMVDFDENDLAYKVFGGYNFGLIPLVDVAVEVSYVDFGSPSAGGVNVGITGINAFGLAGVNFGPFGVFAKFGMSEWDSDISFNGIKSRDSGVDPAYGIGAKLKFSSLSVRAEYEYFDLDSAADVSMLSVSAVFTF